MSDCLSVCPRIIRVCMYTYIGTAIVLWFYYAYFLWEGEGDEQRDAQVYCVHVDVCGFRDAGDGRYMLYVPGGGVKSTGFKEQITLSNI